MNETDICNFVDACACSSSTHYGAGLCCADFLCYSGGVARIDCESTAAGMPFQYSEGTLETIMVIMAEQDGTKQVFFYRKGKNDDSYVLSDQTPVFPPMNGEPVNIGFDGKVYVDHKTTDKHWGCWFEADYLGNWMLAGIDFEGDITAIGVRYNEGIHDVLVCGEYTFDRNIRNLDFEKIPKTIREAAELVNTDGYALVRSDVVKDRLHLRVSPSKNAASLGRYYSGTPVIVHEVDGAWAKVTVGDRSGYMICEFLAFGEDMKNVRIYYPSRIRMAVIENLAGDILFYAEPKTSSKVVARLREEPMGGGYNVVADIDDEWFQVVFDNGLWCYVQKKFFWEGRG